MVDTISVTSLYSLLNTWLQQKLLLPATLIQLSLIFITLIISYLLSGKLGKVLARLYNHLKEKYNVPFEDGLHKTFKKVIFPLLMNLFLWFYLLLAYQYSWPLKIIQAASQLIIAWILIQIIISIFDNKNFVRFLAFFILAVVVLKILNIYNKTIELLDGLAIQFGEFRISLLMFIQGIILLTIMIWLAGRLSLFVKKQIKDKSNLTPSLNVLIEKFTRIILYTIAVLITLSSLGIDLTALTVLSGAIGVGIGFGLQKIVSNFISGIIILMDKSVKPGDVIRISGTLGWVSSLNSRFVSIITLDGEEYLIPNENFITKEVVNLSYSDKHIRLKIPIQISYNSDVKKAIALVQEAVSGSNRIATNPAPRCHLIGFGDSSVNLELRFWISDPKNGIANVKSSVLLNIWEAFQENGIEIPYPQQDVHLKTVDSVNSMKPENIIGSEE